MATSAITSSAIESHPDEVNGTSHPKTTTTFANASSPLAKTEKAKEIPWYSLSPTPWYRPVILVTIVIYALLIIAWGGMLFLLLVGAAPGMCHPSCTDINSSRRLWLERDMQILNALFCVTGFGLAPWRFRDMYFLTKTSLRPGQQSERDLLRLVGWNSWFRPGHGLPDSEARRLQAEVRPRSYFSLSLKGTDPARNPPANLSVPPHLATSPRWKLPFVIWMNFLNTVFQVGLASFMWAQNRLERQTWATSLFVTLACVVGIFGGLVHGMEGGRCSKIEQGMAKLSKRERKARKRGEKTDVEAQVRPVP